MGLCYRDECAEEQEVLSATIERLRALLRESYSYLPLDLRVRIAQELGGIPPSPKRFSRPASRHAWAQFAEALDALVAAEAQEESHALD